MVTFCQSSLDVAVLCQRVMVADSYCQCAMQQSEPCCASHWTGFFHADPHPGVRGHHQSVCRLLLTLATCLEL